MKKFTRRSYNRKLIVFGISLLAAVGLISTGFSAWVMSAVNGAEAGADVNVGIIQDASVNITVDQWDAEAKKWTPLDGEKLLSFDAPKNDGGRLRGSADEDENLSMVISGKVENGAILTTEGSSLIMTITLPDGLKQAIAEEYIKLPDGTDYSTNGIITVPMGDLNYEETAADDGETYQFSYTLTFEWGDFFDGVNPAIFYDSDEHGRLELNAGSETQEFKKLGTVYTDEEMMSQIKAFRNCLTGNAELDAPYTGTIDILVTAELS